MTVRELTGYINAQGELIVDIPPDYPPGKVRVTVAQDQEAAAPPAANDDLPWEERPWTEEELRELIRFEPKTGEEIAQADWIGAWADLGIQDSVEWVNEVKRREESRHKWQW